MTDIMKDTPPSESIAEPSPLPTDSSPSLPAPLAPARSRGVKRRRGVRAVGVLLGVSVLSGGGGWLVAERLSSPADVAARAAARLLRGLWRRWSFGFCARRCLRGARCGLVRRGRLRCRVLR